jgi:hypothetical protein
MQMATMRTLNTTQRRVVQLERAVSTAASAQRLLWQRLEMAQHMQQQWHAQELPLPLQGPVTDGKAGSVKVSAAPAAGPGKAPSHKKQKLQPKPRASCAFDDDAAAVLSGLSRAHAPQGTAARRVTGSSIAPPVALAGLSRPGLLPLLLSPHLPLSAVEREERAAAATAEAAAFGPVLPLSAVEREELAEAEAAAAADAAAGGGGSAESQGSIPRMSGHKRGFPDAPDGDATAFHMVRRGGWLAPVCRPSLHTTTPAHPPLLCTQHGPDTAAGSGGTSGSHYWPSIINEAAGDSDDGDDVVARASAWLRAAGTESLAVATAVAAACAVGATGRPPPAGLVRLLDQFEGVAAAPRE